MSNKRTAITLTGKTALQFRRKRERQGLKQKFLIKAASTLDFTMRAGNPLHMDGKGKYE